jgi:hypothetical protein
MQPDLLPSQYVVDLVVAEIHGDVRRHRTVAINCDSHTSTSSAAPKRDVNAADLDIAVHVLK